MAFLQEALGLHIPAIKGFASRDEYILRLIVLGATCVELTMLFLLKLVKKEALQVYLIWPYSAWLAVRVKIDFLVYPVCAIRTDIGKKANILLVVLLLSIAVLTKESNFLVVALFRAALVVVMEAKRPLILLVLGSAFCVLIDNLYVYLANAIPIIRRFAYTRDIVNPEYSVVESIGVFIASSHLSINPTYGWMLHILFGLALLLVVYRYRSLVDLHVMTAVFLVYFAATSVTHAFQNASYYYFYLTGLLVPIVLKHFYFFIWLSAFHVVSAAMYYGVYKQIIWQG